VSWIHQDGHLFRYVCRSHCFDTAASHTNSLIVPKKEQIFAPNIHYLHEHMFDSEESTLSTLHNWIELSSGKFTSAFHADVKLDAVALMVGNHKSDSEHEKDARGYVAAKKLDISDYESYGLPEPYSDVPVDRHSEGGYAYMIGVFHQLHCLVSVELPYTICLCHGPI